MYDTSTGNVTVYGQSQVLLLTLRVSRVATERPICRSLSHRAPPASRVSKPARAAGCTRASAVPRGPISWRLSRPLPRPPRAPPGPPCCWTPGSPGGGTPPPLGPPFWGGPPPFGILHCSRNWGPSRAPRFAPVQKYVQLQYKK